MSVSKPITIQDILAYFRAKYPNYNSNNHYMYRGHGMRVTIPAFWSEGMICKHDNDHLYPLGLSKPGGRVLFPMKNVEYGNGPIVLSMQTFWDQPILDKESELYKCLS